MTNATADLQAKVVDLVAETITLADGRVIPMADVKDISFTVDTYEWSDGILNHVEPYPDSEQYCFTWMGQQITGRSSEIVVIKNPRTLYGVTHV